MKYVLATISDLHQVVNIVQESIRTIYPKYYPMEVVNFFCELHSTDNIKKDILKGTVGILLVDGVAVGTGCCQDEHITRVYVLPAYQGKGYGTYIMDELEKEVSITHSHAYLDASLPASHLYEKRGYITREHCKYEVADHAVLVYEVMEKELCI